MVAVDHLQLHWWQSLRRKSNGWAVMWSGGRPVDSVGSSAGSGQALDGPILHPLGLRTCQLCREHSHRNRKISAPLACGSAHPSLWEVYHISDRLIFLPPSISATKRYKCSF